MSATREVIRETGGYRLGRNAWLAFNATAPFGSLEIHHDRLVLHTITRALTFPRESITALSVFSGFFSSGLRIQHHIPSYPRFVVFWSSDILRLQQRLGDAGFLVVATNRPNQTMERTAGSPLKG